MKAGVGPRTAMKDTETLALMAGAVGASSLPRAAKRDTGTLAVRVGAVGASSSSDEAKMEAADAASEGGQGAKQAPDDPNSELQTRVRASTSMGWW